MTPLQSTGYRLHAQVCHRLDAWTTGVLVLSRSKAANREFKRSLELREPGVAKAYKALTTAPVPLGRLEHYMYDGPFNAGAPVLGGGSLPPRGPRLLSAWPHAGWKLCALTVVECKVGGVEGAKAGACVQGRRVGRVAHTVGGRVGRWVCTPHTVRTGVGWGGVGAFVHRFACYGEQGCAWLCWFACVVG